MSTSGVVLDGELFHADRIPQPDKVDIWLR
jgi:hypothetical protein